MPELDSLWARYEDSWRRAAADDLRDVFAPDAAYHNVTRGADALVFDRATIIRNHASLFQSITANRGNVDMQLFGVRRVLDDSLALVVGHFRMGQTNGDPSRSLVGRILQLAARSPTGGWRIALELNAQNPPGATLPDDAIGSRLSGGSVWASAGTAAARDTAAWPSLASIATSSGPWEALLSDSVAILRSGRDSWRFGKTGALWPPAYLLGDTVPITTGAATAELRAVRRWRSSALAVDAGYVRVRVAGNAPSHGKYVAAFNRLPAGRWELIAWSVSPAPAEAFERTNPD